MNMLQNLLALISNIGIWINSFFHWGGWTAVSSMTQLLLALAAFFTIYYGFQKDREYLNPKLDLTYSVGLGLEENISTKERSVIAGASINVINVGLSPVYFKDCGVRFGKDDKAPGFFCDIRKPVQLSVGQMSTHSLSHLDKLFLLVEKEGKVTANDKMYIYVTTVSGKTISKETDDNFGSFKYKFEEFHKKVNEQNRPNPERGMNPLHSPE